MYRNDQCLLGNWETNCSRGTVCHWLVLCYKAGVLWLPWQGVGFITSSINSAIVGHGANGDPVLGGFILIVVKESDLLIYAINGHKVTHLWGSL